MTKSFFLQAKNGILFFILLVVSGIIFFMPFIYSLQKHSLFYLTIFLLKIIALPIFAVSLFSLIALGWIKITQTLGLSAGVFLILALFLALAILYLPLWSGFSFFKPGIPNFDPAKRYTIGYANPFNTELNYINIDYLNKEEIGLEIQQTSLKRNQAKLDYGEFEEIIRALNELKNKSRYSLITCPLKFVMDFSFTKRPSSLDVNGASFWFHPEKRFLFRYGFAFPRWCYNFPKIENDLHRTMLNLVNKNLPR